MINDDLDVWLRSIVPHQLTPRQGFGLLFKRDRVPWTGEPLGPPYLDPIFRAGLERQGYNADEYAAQMEAKFRADGIWPADAAPPRDGTAAGEGKA